MRYRFCDIRVNETNNEQRATIVLNTVKTMGKICFCSEKLHEKKETKVTSRREVRWQCIKMPRKNSCRAFILFSTTLPMHLAWMRCETRPWAYSTLLQILPEDIQHLYAWPQSTEHWLLWVRQSVNVIEISCFASQNRDPSKFWLGTFMGIIPLLAVQMLPAKKKRYRPSLEVLTIGNGEKYCFLLDCMKIYVSATLSPHFWSRFFYSNPASIYYDSVY